MKAKTHAVTIGGKLYLVMAQTRTGAIRDAIEHINRELRKDAHVDLATGEQIYQAGVNGDDIIGSDRYKRQVDPNQMDLTGVPLSVDAET